MKINILGSCVSRVSLSDGDQKLHGIALKNAELQYFLDKQSPILAVTPPAFTKEQIESITADELWDKSRIHAVHQCLAKSTIPLLMESEAEYLVIDLFELQTDFLVLGNKTFGTNAGEFMNTRLYHEYKEQFSMANVMTMPPQQYYPVMDVFFDRIMEKYDADHIILIRFRANSYYWSKRGRIEDIPDSLKNPFQANDKYNEPLRNLEDHIIQKYNPYVIDLAKFYMGDAHTWDNIQGAHFEMAFYHDVFQNVQKIIDGKQFDRYIGTADFFNPNTNAVKYPLDVEAALLKLEELIEKEDILWLNILDKLAKVALDHPKVREYMSYLN